MIYLQIILRVLLPERIPTVAHTHTDVKSPTESSKSNLQLKREKLPTVLSLVHSNSLPLSSSTSANNLGRDEKGPHLDYTCRSHISNINKYNEVQRCSSNSKTYNHY